MAKTRFQYYFLIAGIAFLGSFVALVYRQLYRLEEDETQYMWMDYLIAIVCTGISGLLLVATLFLTVVCLHIFTVRSSKHPSITSLLFVYAFNQSMWISSIVKKRKLINCLKEPRRVQEAILQERIKRDTDTKYGSEYQFHRIKNLQDLREHHPLTDYSHYEMYIERMANGEENVLISERLLRFGITSGTTGKGKVYPLTKSRFAIQFNTFAIINGVTSHKYGWASPLQKNMVFYVNPKATRTASGHIVAPVFFFNDSNKFMTHVYSTPWEVLSIHTDLEATYLALLFALRDPTLSSLFGPFCAAVHKSMVFLEKHWKSLVDDIKTGTIDKDLKISAVVREACENLVSAEPERAEELRREFELGFDGIMRRIWPYMRFINGIDTADFTSKLENGYARGIPVFSPVYGGTEGNIGVSLWPGSGKKTKYVLQPDSVIYEFIPEDQMNDKKPTTLFIDEVHKGEVYEMVVSTQGGFYRYRFGDVIKVVDFHYKTPVIEFMYRSGQLMSLKAEKLTEIAVGEAVDIMVNSIKGAELVHWTATESTLLSKITIDTGGEFDQGSQFYLIFVELEEGTEYKILDNETQRQFDDALKDRNYFYEGYRNSGTVSPPRVYLVKPGTFKALQDYIVANSTASYNQFKVPRKLKTADTLKLMLDNRFI